MSRVAPSDATPIRSPENEAFSIPRNARSISPGEFHSCLSETYGNASNNLPAAWFRVLTTIVRESRSPASGPEYAVSVDADH